LWKNLDTATFVGDETLNLVIDYFKKSKQAKAEGKTFCKDDLLDKNIDNSILVKVDQMVRQNKFFYHVLI